MSILLCDGSCWFLNRTQLSQFNIRHRVCELIGMNFWKNQLNDGVLKPQEWGCLLSPHV